ncbi:MAG: hypothetical protein QOH66_469, partial [Actinomycetota bacterium]|nr:hypothetical protein [Actinomycetota bacterium]
LQHQVAVIINVSHHENGASGREESYQLQGTLDPATGQITGVAGQAQVAMVSATWHHLQGQIYANAAVGATQDVVPPGGGAGTTRPFLGLGVGAQGAVVINDTVQFWLQAGPGATLTTGPGRPGSGGGTLISGGASAAAGVTITFP